MRRKFPAWGQFAATLAFWGGLFAAWQNAGAIGFRIDRPAWASELYQVAGYALEPARKQMQDDLNAVKAVIIELKKKKVPKRRYEYLERQRRALERRIQDIDRILERKR